MQKFKEQQKNQVFKVIVFVLKVRMPVNLFQTVSLFNYPCLLLRFNLIKIVITIIIIIFSFPFFEFVLKVFVFVPLFLGAFIIFIILLHLVIQNFLNLKYHYCLNQIHFAQMNFDYQINQMIMKKYLSYLLVFILQEKHHLMISKNQVLQEAHLMVPFLKVIDIMKIYCYLMLSLRVSKQFIIQNFFNPQILLRVFLKSNHQTLIFKASFQKSLTQHLLQFL